MEKMPFHYTIISHPRRKRIAISVTPEGKVIVRTPPRTARKRIEKMLEENAGWVMESLSRVQAGDRKKWRWEPGGVMPPLGQEMTVALAVGQKPGIDGGRILLSGDGPEDWARCGAALYRQIAGEYMQKLVSELEPLVGVRAAGVNIGNARRSWGCCRKDGVIRFSWRLVGMQQIETSMFRAVCSHLEHLGTLFGQFVKSGDHRKSNAFLLHQYVFQYFNAVVQTLAQGENHKMCLCFFAFLFLSVLLETILHFPP